MVTTEEPLDGEGLHPDVCDYIFSFSRGVPGSEITEAISRALHRYNNGERTQLLKLYSNGDQSDETPSMKSGLIVELYGEDGPDCIYAKLNTDNSYTSLEVKSSLGKNDLNKINVYINEVLDEISGEGPLYDNY